MQYLLEHDEYMKLVTKQRLELKLQQDKLQKLCTKIAEDMPVVWGWGGPDPKPWGCILSENEDKDPGYCDKCPVDEICPNERKRWSK
jgi:hypothetical protein